MNSIGIAHSTFNVAQPFSRSIIWWCLHHFFWLSRNSFQENQFKKETIMEKRNNAVDHLDEELIRVGLTLMSNNDVDQRPETDGTESGRCLKRVQVFVLWMKSVRCVNIQSTLHNSKHIGSKKRMKYTIFRVRCRSSSHTKKREP